MEVQRLKTLHNPSNLINKNHFAREFSFLSFFLIFVILLFLGYGLTVLTTNLSIRWIWWSAHNLKHSTNAHTIHSLARRWCDVIISMNGVWEGKNTYQNAESSSRHLASGEALICTPVNMSNDMSIQAKWLDDFFSFFVFDLQIKFKFLCAYIFVCMFYVLYKTNGLFWFVLLLWFDILFWSSDYVYIFIVLFV